MKKRVVRFAVVAIPVACAHFALVLVLVRAEARAVSGMINGTDVNGMQQVLSSERFLNVLGFPVTQCINRPQVVTEGTRSTVPPLAPFVFPMASVIWGCTAAFMFVRIAKQAKGPTSKKPAPDTPVVGRKQ